MSSILWFAYKGVYKHTENTDTLLLQQPLHVAEGVNAKCATLLCNDTDTALCTTIASGLIVSVVERQKFCRFIT